MTSFLISGHCSIKNAVLSNFFISQRIKLKFDTWIQNWMLILISGSKSGFGDDFGQYDKKKHYFTSLFGQTPLRNSVAMATPKVLGDKKLFETVCYTLILKVTKFQLPAPNSS